MFVSPTTAHDRTMLRQRRTPPSRPVDAGREQATERRTAAHVLRRLALSPHPDRVDELAGRTLSDTVAAMFDEGTIRRHQAASAPTAPPSDDDDGDLDTDDIVAWWLDQMAAADTGIVDRMAWFWHGHLTTNAQKVGDPLLIAQQLDTLRSGGLGNFRTLLHEVITGGAMLEYLDANYSEASNPNENLARELMELFTVGRGHYSEDDVRAAARALAGWIVESTDDGPTTVTWHRDRAFIAPLLFLGEQAKWDTELVIDRLCDDPATAARVASALWDHVVRRPLTDEGREELGRWWAGRDLEIRPLVERICADDAFADSIGAGVRSPIEWWAATTTALGLERSDPWAIRQLGQYPYDPPNVAGWPAGDRWLSPGSMLGRVRFLYGIDPAELPDLPAATDAILERCSLVDVDPSTRDAIESVASIPDIDPASRVAARWRLALASPEFQRA
ncbi:MAG: DUF1800 family protein [Acidimicrobiales bacterium]